MTGTALSRAFLAFDAAARTRELRPHSPHGTSFRFKAGEGVRRHALAANGHFLPDPVFSSHHDRLAHAAFWLPAERAFADLIAALHAHPVFAPLAHDVTVETIRSRERHANLSFASIRAWTLSMRRLLAADVASILQQDATEVSDEAARFLLIDPMGPAILGRAEAPEASLRCAAALVRSGPGANVPEAWPYARSWKQGHAPPPAASTGHGANAPWWAILGEGYGFVSTLQADTPEHAAAVFSRLYAPRPVAGASSGFSLPPRAESLALSVWRIPHSSNLARKLRMPS